METRRYLQLLAALFLITTFLFSSVLAVPISPEIKEKLKEEGRLDKHYESMKQAKLKGVNVPSPKKFVPKIAAGYNEDAVDTLSVLVLLVEFPDNLADGGNVEGVTWETFDSILFSTDYINPTGSMTEFYHENSYGKLHIEGFVTPWIPMEQDYAYYVDGQKGFGDYPQNVQKLVEDAVIMADTLLGLDFGQFDKYGPGGSPDGEIDGLMLIHAGAGYETTGNENMIHSHKWYTSYTMFIDGIQIQPYSMQPEENGQAGVAPIGVFCHEFGHVLGLPDLYDYDYEPASSDGLGDWSLMASGSYNGNSRQPAHFDAWCKEQLGFVDPIEVVSNMENVEFPQVESEPVVYKIWKDGIYGQEYFLVENRQKVGFDSYIPAAGLLIFHVDNSVGYGNLDVEHYHVALEQADGQFELEYTIGNNGDADDPWPGGHNKRSFDDLSIPNSRGYGDYQTRVSVWNISDSDSLMTANLDVTWSRPYFNLISSSFSDADDDELFEAGETVEFYFELENYWLDATAASITLSSTNDNISYSNPSVNYTVIAGGGAPVNNTLDPIVFQMPSPLEPAFDTFFVTVESNGGQFIEVYPIERAVGTPDFLIVDDDRGDTLENVYYDDFYTKRRPITIWDCSSEGTPTTDIIDKYSSVFWFTGDTGQDLISTEDINALKYIMDSGRNLFLSGQWLSGELAVDDSAFLRDYLFARHISRGMGFPDLVGNTENVTPIAQGMKIRLQSSGGVQDFMQSEKIEILSPAVPEFKYDIIGGYNSLSYAGDYRLFFFNFSFESLANEGGNYQSRDSLLTNILTFFLDKPVDVVDDPVADVKPGSFDLNQNYPNPFNPTTTISYTIHRAGNAPVDKTELKIYNALGQEVKTLVDDYQRPGSYEVQWDGTDRNGDKVSSGIYFYRLIKGDSKETRKMVLLK